MSEKKAVTPENPPPVGVDDVADPDELMGDISKLSFLKVGAISLLAHAVLIGVTSTTYIQQCVKYGTMHPWVEIQEIDRKERLEKRRKEREASQKQLIEDRKKAKAAKKGEDKDGAKPAGGKDDPAPKGGTPNGNGGTKPKKTPGVKDSSGLDLLGDSATKPEAP